MDDKPFFIDEKELQAVKDRMAEKKAEEEDVIEKVSVEEPKTEVVENTVKEVNELQKQPVVNENNDKKQHALVKSKVQTSDVMTLNKENGEKLPFVMDLKLFLTIMSCIIVAYFFLQTARNLYYGFRYYNKPDNTQTVAPQK